MKYTGKQKEKATTKLNHHKISMEAFMRLSYIRNNYPINVYIENGFYIVDSKMNSVYL